MTVPTEPFEGLVSHAHETRVVVVGGGIGGLVAALECAKVGMPVTVVEATPRLGGTISGAEFEGLPLDLGASCWSAGGGTVRTLVEEVGLGDRVVTPNTDRTWIAALPKGAAAALPEHTVVGIPANPWDESVRGVIGWRGAWRAYVDRLRPPLTIGTERNLGRLVRSRMGAAVHDRLVAPLTFGRFGLAPEQVDVVAAAPGLTAALTRTGSLGGAVADLLVDRADAPAPAIESLDGGIAQLVSALEDRLRVLGAEIVLESPVTAVSRAGGRWRLDLDTAAPEAPGEAVGALTADIVIVAAGRDEAQRLLGSAGVTPTEAEPAHAGIVREVVTLVVDEPALDGAPRGAQVYPLPGTRLASGLVHQTARWEWLARAAGPGRHVVSVAFDHPADEGHESIERARGEASVLLGVPLDESTVRAAHTARFELAAPASALGREG
uniref:protoporphyrinogen/coproporphyrinogen oxidase n=1 Tax=Microbacterium sp. CPCC 204701 TaxID=2493084 RepID=UPI000FD99D09